MEKKKGFHGEIGVNTNRCYGSTSLYEYYNYGVDLILKEFKPCEEALGRVKDAEAIWAQREQALEEEYRQRAADVQRNLRALKEENEEDGATAALQRERQRLKEEIQRLESDVERLSGEEPGGRDGSFTGEREAILHRAYEKSLERYKALDADKRQNPVLQPLNSILEKEEELVSQQASCEMDIASGKEQLKENAFRKALEDVRPILVKEEQQNPAAAVKRAQEYLVHREDPEQAAREYADANHRVRVGRVSLDSLKAVGRGLFCIPMIPVRSFALKKKVYRLFLKRRRGAGQVPGEMDAQKAKKVNWVLDGVSLLLNLILVIILVTNNAVIGSAFAGLLPVMAVIGLLAGAGLGFLKGKNIAMALIGSLAGVLVCVLLDVLLFVYPVFMMNLLRRVWPFCLWLAASIILYGAEDIYQLINRVRLEAEYALLLEEGKRRCNALYEYSNKVAYVYADAQDHALRAEKERIGGLEFALEKSRMMLEETRQILKEKEALVWEAYKAQAIEAEEEAWQRSRLELEKLQERKQDMEADIQRINGELAENDRRLEERCTDLKVKLDNLNQERERERNKRRRAWEEESARAREDYESHLDSLVGQLRKDGFQHLTCNEEKGVEGFDYRKAWSRMYYLATSVIGMTPYQGWYMKEGAEVLNSMISDAAWIPFRSGYMNVVPTRLITGIEKCPMASEIQERVEAVMKEWQQDMNKNDVSSPEERRNYMMNLNLPRDGFYKLCLNEVDGRVWEEGDMYPTIFVYDFGNLDENNDKRQALRNFVLRTLCAPALQCWKLLPKFHIDLMLTDHKGDFENFKAWEVYGAAGKIYQGADIEDGLVNAYKAGKETMELAGSKSYFEKVRNEAWDDEPFEGHDRAMIFINIDYKVLSRMEKGIENVLDITNMDKKMKQAGNKSQSGICPYFFMDLHRLQAGEKAAAQVCLKILEKFKGHIYRLEEKKIEENDEKGFYDWKVMERRELQEILSELASSNPV